MLDKFRETAITWDKANRKVYEPLRVSAGDNKGRKLSVQVVNGGVVENITGSSLSLFWETRDKAHRGLDVFTAVDATKGEFEIFYTTGMLSNEGVLNANLVLVDTSGRVVSEPFTITVFKGIDDNAIQSSDSFTALTEALIDISDLEQNYAPRLNDLTAQLQQIAYNATKPPAPLKPLVGDANYYDAVNFKYYSDSAMTIPATDNQPALQALVDYVHAQGGGTIFLPKGNYAVRSRTIWMSKVSLIGGGRAVTNILAEGYLFSVFQGSGWYGDGSQASDASIWNEDFTFSDFCIDSKGLSSPYSSVDGKALFMLYNRRAKFERLLLKNTIGTAMGCDFLPDCVIDNIVVINAGRNWGQPEGADKPNPSTVGQSGIGIGTGALEWEPLVVTNCFIYGCGNFGIFIEDQTLDSTGSKGKGAKIIGNHVENNRIGLANLGTGESLFANNIVYNNKLQGINFVRGANDMSILDNHVYANKGPGIFGDNYLPNKNIKIAGNTIHHNKGMGIHLGLVAVAGTHKILDVLLEGNTIHSNDRYGIFVDANHKRFISIKGNTIYNNGQAPLVSEDKTGIRVQGNNDNIFITENVVYDSQTIKTQTHALRMYDVITDYLVKDNNFTDLGTYIVPTTGKIKGNIGLTDNDIVTPDKHAFGKVTFAIGEEYIYVNHFLGRAADSITITPLGKADVWIFENTEGNRSRLRRADTTTSLTVYWQASLDM